MKIVFIRFPKSLYQSGKKILGGSEIANQYLIDYFRSKEIEVIEFSPKTPDRIEIGELPAIGTLLMFQDLIRQSDEINKCDVMISSHWFCAIVPEITIPVITIYHSNARLVLRSINDSLGVEESIFDKWLARLEKYGLGKRSHDSIFDQIISISEEYLLKKSAKTVAVSNFLKETLIEDYKIDPEKIKVIYNINPIDWINREVKKDFSQQRLRVINVTRLPVEYSAIKPKGIDRIFEIFSKAANVDKYMLGSTITGKYKDFMQSNFSDVNFIENATREEVFDNVSKSHILFQSSRCESFGLSLTEAMLTGTIPITFPVGVAGEIIENGKNGFIVHSVEEVVERIDYLDKNRQILDEISQNARKTVLSKMSDEAVGEEYIKLIREIIE